MSHGDQAVPGIVGEGLGAIEREGEKVTSTVSTKLKKREAEKVTSQEAEKVDVTFSASQSSKPNDLKYNLYLTARPAKPKIPILPVNVGYPAGVDDSTYSQLEMYSPGGILRLGISTDEPKVLNSIPVFITLDDGPHNQPLVNNAAQGDAGRQNWTERWLDFLKLLAHNGEMDGLIASFWVQTHANFTIDQQTHQPVFNNNRGQSTIGKVMLKRESTDGHIIGIHTGSDEDHALHWIRVGEPAYAGGQSALESDLIRAKAFLVSDVIGYTGLKYVRAPGFDLQHDAAPDPALKKKVCDTYARQSLKHIGAEIYCDTNWQRGVIPPTNAGMVLQVLSSDAAKQKYKNSANFIAFLFHDPTKPFHTLNAMKAYLKRIRQELLAVNKVPQYITRTKMEGIFDAKNIGVHC